MQVSSRSTAGALLGLLVALAAPALLAHHLSGQSAGASEVQFADANKNKGNSGQAQGNSGKSGGSDSGVSVLLDGNLSIRFSDSEIRIINDYYRQHPATGLGSLPPGIAKNLQRGKPLPPGIAKKALPADLVTLLPAVRDGTNRVIVGDDILLVEVSTGLILDILNGVFN